jgi:hypothetical protein
MPSIAFYGQPGFKTAIDPTDDAATLYWYKSITPVVVIADQGTFERVFKPFVPKSKIVKIPIVLIDRHQTNNYYIFSNF